MKTYRVSRKYLWLRAGMKLIATLAAAGVYVRAVTHPMPLPARFALLGAFAVFGYLMYVRQPRMPTEITLEDDGAIAFRGRRGEMRVRAEEIRSIAASPGRRSVRVRYAGGRLRIPNRFPGFYDFLATLKRWNPAVEIKGF
jgi:hypothetical protein